eukprot:scaffold14370_cov72-Phaeocystis_antarctica.AAC.1
MPRHAWPTIHAVTLLGRASGKMKPKMPSAAKTRTAVRRRRLWKAGEETAERGKPACSKYATNGCVRRSGPSPVRNAATHELTSSIDKTSGFIEDCYGVAEDWLVESTPLSRGRTARRTIARTAPVTKKWGGILPWPQEFKTAFSRFSARPRGGRRGGRGGSHRRRRRLAQQITPPTHSRNVRARPLAKKNRPTVCFSTPSADRSAAGRHGGPGARWPSAYMRSAPPTPLYAARCLERKGEPRAPEH